ncbi:MAG: hypothetical protein V4692_09115 [Bdellovibrionota bacterium]
MSFAPDFAVVVAGERSRLQPLLAPRFDWNRAPKEESLRLPDDWKTKVLSFEKDLPAGFKAYFAPDDARSFDRSVIVHAELDGSAIVDELSRLTGKSVALQGAESSFETTSACRWTSPRLTEFLLGKEGSEERVRGMVIIDTATIDSNLKMLLKQTAETLLRQQNG